MNDSFEEVWPSSLAHAREQIIALHADNERLRAALQPFAYEYDILMQQQDSFPAWHSVKTEHLRGARAALEPKP